MPAGPVMRPGTEAWHGGPSTWALGCVGGGIQGLPPTGPLSHRGRWGEEDPDPLTQWLWWLLAGIHSCQLCSSERCRVGREWNRYRRAATSLSQNPHRNLPSQQQKQLPSWFYSSFDTLICVKWSADPSHVCLVSADTSLGPTFGTWPDRITQHKRVSGEQLWLGFPNICEHCEHLSAFVGWWVKVTRLCGQKHNPPSCDASNSLVWSNWQKKMANAWLVSCAKGKCK